MVHTPQGVATTLKSAIERRDVEMLLSLYDDDAEIKIVDRNHSPSAPLALHGKPAIEGYFREIFARNTAHHVVQEIVDQSHMAFSESCQYLDGARIYKQCACELKDGKIIRQTDVQAWDEQPHH